MYSAKRFGIHVTIVDPSMDILYEDGKGPVFKESLSWLQSASEHLRMSGALAIGNFARNGKSSFFDRINYFVVWDDVRLVRLNEPENATSCS